LSNVFELALPPETIELIAEKVAERVGAGSRVDGFLTVDRAAEYLACERHRIYDLCRRGGLRHARDGKRLLFRREWLDDVLDLRKAA
jgi:excisionase family DNA binding protein